MQASGWYLVYGTLAAACSVIFCIPKTAYNFKKASEERRASGFEGECALRG
jgi:hypothetical protein